MNSGPPSQTGVFNKSMQRKSNLGNAGAMAMGGNAMSPTSSGKN